MRLALMLRSIRRQAGEKGMMGEDAGIKFI